MFMAVHPKDIVNIYGVCCKIYFVKYIIKCKKIAIEIVDSIISNIISKTK